MAVNSPGLVGRFWEWIGWRSSKISEHRIETRNGREEAELKLEVTLSRVEKTNGMANWLRERNEQNHIAEALAAAFSDPRRRS